MNSLTNWLAEEDPAKLAAEMIRRINTYAERLDSTGKTDIMRRMSRLAFSRDADSNLRGTSVQTGGANGELIGTRANLLGRYVRAVSIQVTGSRPSYQARSIASSAEAISAVNAANGLLDHMNSKKGAEEAARRAEVFESLYGMSWLAVTWDERAGKLLGMEVLDPRTGQPIKGADGQPVMIQRGQQPPDGVAVRARYEGDIRFTPKRPDEVVFDVDLDESGEHEWLIVARQVSRFRLAQQYPSWEDHILQAQSNTQLDVIRGNLRLDWKSAERKSNGDLVTVYELFAPPSVSVEEGRYAMLCGGEVIALDRALYDDLAHYEMCSTYEPSSKFGYSYLWELCGLQQVSDGALVSLISSVENYGKPYVFIPEGSDLDTSKDASLLPFHVIRGTAKPEIFGMDPGILAPLTMARDSYESNMMTISGMNDTVMGDASKSQSGEALQTMHSLAAQSVSSKQASYAKAYGESMMGGIKRYRAFATGPRIIQITGKSYAGDVAQFKAADVLSIDSIDTEMLPAIMQHNEGRKQIADKLWGSGALGQDPTRYMEVMATGRVEPILDGPNAERKLIQGENEALREGKPVFVLPTDNDDLHIVEHAVPLSDPTMRNPADPRVQGILAHIDQHKQSKAQKAMQEQAQMMAMQPPAPPDPNAPPPAGDDQAPPPGMDPSQGGAMPPAGAGPAPDMPIA